PRSAAADSPGERAGRTGGPPAARAGLRSGARRAGLTAGGDRHRLAERMVRGVPCRVRAHRRRPAGSTSQIRPGAARAVARDGCGVRLCLAPVADLLSAYLITGTDRPKVTRALRRLRD